MIAAELCRLYLSSHIERRPGIIKAPELSPDAFILFFSRKFHNYRKHFFEKI